MLIEQLAKDEAIAEADTLLLTVPNQLGVDYNAHVIEAILKHVAPGWAGAEASQGRPNASFRGGRKAEPGIHNPRSSGIALRDWTARIVATDFGSRLSARPGMTILISTAQKTDDQRKPAIALRRPSKNARRQCDGSLSSIPLTYQFMLRTWPMSRWSPPLHSTALPS